jgi:hypothetical protein
MYSMRINVSLICLFITLLLQVPADAAGPIQEIVQPKGLFLLGDFSQWTSLTYEYNGHTSGGSNYNINSHTFKEKYHLNTDVSVLDPHLLNLRLDGDIWLEQGNYSGGAANSGTLSNSQYRYNFLGSAFDNSVHPVSVVSFRELTEVVTPYSPRYTTDSTQNGINFAFLNEILPFWGQYMRRTIDTNGLTQDSSSTSDDFNFRVRHNLRDVSITEAYTDYYRQDVHRDFHRTTTSRNYMFSLTNTTYFDQKKQYSLSSQLQGVQGESADTPQKTLDWTEVLTCHFGTALEGLFSYRYNYDKTLGYNNLDQVTRTETYNAALRHRLYQSLETRISGSYRHGEVLGGNETEYKGTVGAIYQKKLPSDSSILLSVTGEHEVTDRNLLGSQLTVRDQLHRNVQQGEIITLTNTGSLENVFSVQSRNPDIWYIEGRDYRIDFTLGRIEILHGGTIVPGIDLYISYQFQVNPTVKYSTDTISSSGTLSLFNNRYRLWVNQLTQDQNQISGQISNVSLTNTRSLLVHADANYLYNRLSLEYSDYSANSTSYSYYEAAWQLNLPLPLSSISLRARDRYTIYDQINHRPSYAENTVDLGASYTRALFSWAQLTMAVNYFNTQGDRYNRDYVYAKVNLQGRINKLFINLVGQSTWRDSGSLNTRDDYVRLELRRYF